NTRSRAWGLVVAAVLVAAAVLLGIAVIWRRGPEPAVSATDTPTEALADTPSPVPATPAPTPMRPLTYTVQGGDTLSAIAEEHEISVEALVAANNLVNPDVLQIGQTLIIPRGGSTNPDALASPAAPPEDSLEGQENILVPPTLTPSGPPGVEITRISGIGDLGTEGVALRNEGGTVSLEAWTLSNPTDDGFVFPALTLFMDGEVYVHSGSGDDTPRDLYWGRTEAVWQQGQLATLRDAEGNVVDTYSVSR
ncbi:MAG: LysM peptidoglycan-binding domain-containing protein, partial [Anaerolineae bacterium]